MLFFSDSRDWASNAHRSKSGQALANGLLNKPAMARFFRAGLAFKILCMAAWLSILAVGVDAQASSSAQAALKWNASVDPSVVGYYVYYGTSVGQYAYKIDVGTNTTFTAAGLTPGLTYYFTMTAYNTAGIESDQAPQISYDVPESLLLTPNPSAGVVRIQFAVAAARSYQLQTSINLKAWANLWSIPNEATNGLFEFDDPMPPGSVKFYRLLIQ